ncbi:MAG: flagellar biosynthesis protein FlhB [Deltaproteobacteria bacterium]|jgi:flagellar biosynthetic protein FlhB|nr:flagellar biosynthesis protein FlhB [Deltaproteobacteria bacterium]
MPQKDPSRTEKPTPKQIDRARKKGNVPKSAEISGTLNVLIGVIITYIWIRYVGEELLDLLRRFFLYEIDAFDPTPGNIYVLFISMSASVAKMVLPIILTIGVCSYIVQRLQVGKLWTAEPLRPKFSKMNPLNGIKRMFFSLGTLGRLFKNMFKALVIGLVPFLVLRDEMPQFITLYYTDAAGLCLYILKTGFRIVLYSLIPMVIIAVIDLIYTRWDYIENLKMTKAEVKDEQRQAEGDPTIKSKQRQKMFQMAKRRMMQDVPKADVVITNPTHIAVALKYDAVVAPAPVVLAKGAGRVAEKIKEIARANNVPIRENKPLARALFQQAEIGETIPKDLYHAVAAILAQLWKQKGRGMPGRAG